MSVAREELERAKFLMNEAQDTNVSVLLLHLTGSDKATRVHRKTNRRACRRAKQLCDLYEKIERENESVTS